MIPPVRFSVSQGDGDETARVKMLLRIDERLNENDLLRMSIQATLNERQDSRAPLAGKNEPAPEAASLASQHRPFPFKGKDRKGMGPRPAEESASASTFPHPPTGLPLEGGGEGRTKRNSP